jgi:hypothetical protein
MNRPRRDTRREDWSFYAVVVVAAVVAVLGILNYWWQSRACDRRGGVLVTGVARNLYVCVAAPPVVRP